MKNPNRKIKSITNLLVKNKLIIIFTILLLIAFLSTIWAGYTQLKERDKEISILNEKILSINNELEKNKKENKENKNIIENLNIQLKEQEEIIFNLEKNLLEKEEVNKKLKNENNNLLKKYRELVMP